MPTGIPSTSPLLRQLTTIIELLVLVPPPDDNGEAFLPRGIDAKTIHARRRELLVEAFAKDTYGGLGHVTLRDLEDTIADTLAGGEKRLFAKDTPAQAARRQRATELAARLVAHVFDFGSRELKDLAPEVVKRHEAAKKAAEAERRAAAAKKTAKAHAKAYGPKPKAAKPVSDRLSYAKPAKAAKPAKPKAKKPAATKKATAAKGKTAAPTSNGVSSGITHATNPGAA